MVSQGSPVDTVVVVTMVSAGNVIVVSEPDIDVVIVSGGRVIVVKMSSVVTDISVVVSVAVVASRS